MKRMRDGQMILLTGIVLALSIIALSVISSQMANLRILVPQQRMTSILDEYRNLRESFGKALNYNLVDAYNNSVSSSLDWPDAWYCYYVGDIENIEEAFNETFEEFYTLELSKGNFFDAKLLDYWPNENGITYTIVLSLSLSDGEESISEIVSYSIVCNPYLTYIKG